MFHIHISGHKYLCAKNTFCFILIGEKRLGASEGNRNPPTSRRRRTEDTTSGCGGRRGGGNCHHNR
ncbi:hypothetical protein AB205_0061800 [Aquarana catesbeiana]|uniref:Uncharacterized protein n=1 Tax=Aquarana catesbeiana TaxID=8400 RepID=A0A2G9QK89_AQUCT|nr:hypothetical protein AB205_0061800 [Aquarana catesbeiana]